jgi:magnesium chelatase family protein
MACQQAKHRLVLPNNLEEANQLQFEVYAAKHLQDVCAHFLGTSHLSAAPNMKIYHYSVSI